MHAFAFSGNGFVFTQSLNRLMTVCGATYPQLTTLYPVPQDAGAGKRDVDSASSVALIDEASG